MASTIKNVEKGGGLFEPWFTPGWSPTKKKTTKVPENKMIQDALSVARATIQPEIDAADAAIALTNKEGLKQAERDVAIANALALGLGQTPGRIREIYSNAQSAIGGLSSGFSSGMKAAADEQAAIQQRMLAGTGQEGAIRREGDTLGDTFSVLGKYIPSSSLAKQGAAWESAASLLPEKTKGQGLIAAALTRQKTLEAVAALRVKRDALTAKIPSLTNTAYSSLYAQAIRDSLLAVNTRAAKVTEARDRTNATGWVHVVDASGNVVQTGAKKWVAPRRGGVGGSAKGIAGVPAHVLYALSQNIQEDVKATIPVPQVAGKVQLFTPEQYEKSFNVLYEANKGIFGYADTEQKVQILDTYLREAIKNVLGANGLFPRQPVPGLVRGD